jgi:ATP-binding cassette subfamily B protein
VLFDGTVEFNISLGMPGISREQVIKAAREIGASRFIERLPGGYDFEIREHGSNLSQGQKQLLAFARALAKNPSLVVLDEATSSIDPESEGVIQEATTRLLKDRTVIVIAHRLSTIRQCNQIIVIDKGQIIESGTHQNLLAANGAYFKLYSAFV